MALRNFGLLWLAMISTTTIAARATPVVVCPVKPVVNCRPIQAASDIWITGRIHVNLHTGYAKPTICFKGNPQDLAHLNVVNGDNRLEVQLFGMPKFGEVAADIKLSSLHNLHYRGAGIVKGMHISANPLTLNITNPGKTVLAGNINLRSLTVHGDGLVSISNIRTTALILKVKGSARVQLAGIIGLQRLSLDDHSWVEMGWIDSPSLHINMTQHARVSLAGITDALYLNAFQSAHFNGRFLRARQTFVKTHQHAVAEIATVDRQHTLATDASDIYFYNIPDDKTDFMGFNGAVLDLRDWSMPYMQEYSRYNR